MRTFTANRGAAPCDTDAPTGTQTATATFTVRIWGKLCRKSSSNVQKCWDLNNPTPPESVGCYVTVQAVDIPWIAGCGGTT